MQEQTIIKVNLSDGDKLSLYKELVQNLDKITALLVGYHFKSRGRVINVSVIESSVEFIKPLMATFMVQYTIGQFNACADVDFTEAATMEMLVDINLEKAEAVITGEYIPEREPDEF
ncbi:MAG: hypothetical protein H7Y07_01300 [Pyrinomonadaceae bacterium]|nr:hypothetical protein [Sphingobacteriaceae bacterium]